MSRIAPTRTPSLAEGGGEKGGGGPSSVCCRGLGPVFILLCLVCMAGCAHVKAGSDRVLVFPPVVITAGNVQDRELAQLNPSELLAKGRAAFGAQDYPTAAKCFSRGADFYPDSPLHGALSYNAGLALLQQHEWAQALERFKVLAEPKAGEGDALD